MSNTLATTVSNVTAPARTRWPVIAFLMGCGIVAAAHVGKVAPAIPVLREELGIGDLAAGVMLSSITSAGAVLAYPLGRELQRRDPRMSLAGALIWLGALSLVGAVPADPAIIMLARAAESLGFLVAVLTIPSLLRADTVASDRRFVMALWGAYMPMGTGLAMLVAPAVLTSWTWRGLWVISGIGCLLMALGVLVARSVGTGDAPAGIAPEPSHDPPGFHADLVRLAAIFAVYAGVYLAVMGLLPTALYESGTSIAFASVGTGLAVLVNAPGNYVAAHFIRSGLPLVTAVAIASVGMVLSSWGIYRSTSPLLIVASSFVFSFICGLVPASLFGQLNRIGDPRRLPVATGALVQGSSIGQLLGPPAFVSLLALGMPTSFTGPVIIALAGVAMLFIARHVRC